MLSIGIDVSKGKSTVCGMKPGGEIVYAPFEVQHTREGMSELVSLLHNSGEEVRVVLESTGSYHCPPIITKISIASEASYPLRVLCLFCTNAK